MSDFFDDLTTGFDPAQAYKQASDSKAKAEKLDYLIYQTFTSDKGKELLALWEQTLIMTAGAEEGMDLVGIGIREGYKRFIRNIKLTIKRVEES